MRDGTLFQQFSSSLPATPAEDWVFCPKCNSTTVVKTTFNEFSAWNYKQERIVDRDARGQLCSRMVWYSCHVKWCGCK